MNCIERRNAKLRSADTGNVSLLIVVVVVVVVVVDTCLFSIRFYICERQPANLVS